MEILPDKKYRTIIKRPLQKSWELNSLPYLTQAFDKLSAIHNVSPPKELLWLPDDINYENSRTGYVTEEGGIFVISPEVYSHYQYNNQKDWLLIVYKIWYRYLCWVDKQDRADLFAQIAVSLSFNQE